MGKEKARELGGAGNGSARRPGEPDARITGCQRSVSAEE